ncbi:DUF4142 domain-containing protein [Nonomuraea sp. NN258]|uniref:DUF4142 domain-containing protein n=1 Tax=Nonomuraea antri TaxID=2730852 RepID=UPI001569AAD2|nr:DUF4142 domain-containing protein [Nonomuraea antri]NRQ40756.1 DUF4142 domain-containing protein [Nonomuraea antri]
MRVDTECSRRTALTMVGSLTALSLTSSCADGYGARRYGQADLAANAADTPSEEHDPLQDSAQNPEPNDAAAADPTAEAENETEDEDGAEDGDEVRQTRWGPLNAADRDLLIKVRQAGLWEIPVGQQGAGRAAKATTRAHMAEIARQHIALDQIVRSVAQKLRVPLPDQPTDDQQKWMREISGKSGVAYDRIAVRRMRLAHGKVYPVIAAVRASTRNTLIRSFAKQAETFVHGHLEMLEETGFVDARALPPPPEVPQPPKGGDLPAPPATEVI